MKNTKRKEMKEKKRNKIFIYIYDVIVTSFNLINQWEFNKHIQGIKNT